MSDILRARKAVKRFYKTVTTHFGAEGYSILLDGRPVKTKLGHILATPCEAVADRLVQEWASQDIHIIPDSMPMTQILNTKIDRISKDRQAMTVIILKYFNTDLLSYPTEEPQDLALEQEIIWGPWRNWFSKESGVALLTTQGLFAIQQAPEAHCFLEQRISNMEDDCFTILQSVTALCGSVILALAFVECAAQPQDVLNAFFVEENYKDRLYDADKYGPDPMQKKKLDAMSRDLEAASFYLRAIKA